MELKEITALSFEIKENQILLAYCIYTEDTTLYRKQESLREKLRLLNFCPSQCCDYSFTSPGPRELEHRVRWNEDE